MNKGQPAPVAIGNFSEVTSSKKQRKRKSFKKPPQAPRRFRSPYILFSVSKIAEYKASSTNVQVTSMSRLIAKEWKALSDEERKKWDEAAREDKRRYDAETMLYRGPWQVPSQPTRKDPSAPKRPPSAFLFYCQNMRTLLKEQNPGLNNAEISKVMGEKWKSAPPEVRQPYIEREQRERDAYKPRIAMWRKARQEMEEASRMQRKAVVEQFMQHLKDHSGSQPASGTDSSQSIPVEAPPSPCPSPPVTPTLQQPPLQQPTLQQPALPQPLVNSQVYTAVPTASLRQCSDPEQTVELTNTKPPPPVPSAVVSHCLEWPSGLLSKQYDDVPSCTIQYSGFVPSGKTCYIDGLYGFAQSAGSSNSENFVPIFRGDIVYDPPMIFLD